MQLPKAFSYCINKASSICNGTDQIMNAAMLIGVGGILSRFLGLLRDRLLASTFGASRDLDIYYAAFRIPDFIYSLLILGAISAVFIPVFASFSSKEERNVFASSALNLVTLLIGGLSLLLVLFIPFFIELIAPGFAANEKEITILLTRIMLLQPILLAMSSGVTSILQSSQRFFTTALAPSLYNIGIILGILLFVPFAGLKGLAYGVVVGGALHLFVQLPALAKTDFLWQPIVSFTKEIKTMFTLMGPRMLGVASDQINLVVITALASTLASGSIAIFNLAQNIQGAPVGIIGIAIATAVFPTLSQTFSRDAKGEFSKTFLESFRLILFFAIPLSLLFILLRAQIVRVVLGTGLFSWENTRLSAAALGIFGVSLFAQSLIPLLTRAFYSMQDTKTPVAIGVSGVIVNVVLAVSFLHLLGSPTSFFHLIVQTLKLQALPDIRIVALPLAFSLTMILEFLFLFVILFLRLDGESLTQLNKSWLKIVGAAFLMALVTYGFLRPLATIVDMTTGLGVFLQGLGAGIIGIAVYFLITALLKENPLLTNSKSQSASWRTNHKQIQNSKF